MPDAAGSGGRLEKCRSAVICRDGPREDHRDPPWFCGDAPMTFVVAAADLRRFCPSFCGVAEKRSVKTTVVYRGFIFGPVITFVLACAAFALIQAVFIRLFVGCATKCARNGRDLPWFGTCAVMLVATARGWAAA
jgi:hypothetical protein